MQSSFTIKEIREVSKIKGVKLYGVREEFESSINEASEREMQADFSVHARGLKRKTDFLREHCTLLNNEE